MEEIKLTLFTNCTIVYIENFKESTFRETLPELISEFNKFAGFKINTQKSTAFLYTTMNMWKPKLKHNTIYNHTKENEILCCKSDKTCIGRTVLSDENHRTDERNQRRSKQMKRHIMFMNKKTQHSKDVNSPRIDL